MRQNKGMISVDFLFALVLVMGLSAILLALSLSLTVAELTQYITFSAARNYFPGHINPTMQIARARQKYAELISNPQVNRLYTSGWFEVSGTPQIGDMTQVYPAYRQQGSNPNQFWGVGTNFIARILDFEIPFYGSTAALGDGSGSSFNTFIASYLGRETSESECLQFVQKRWQAIRSLSVPAGMSSYTNNTLESGYRSYDDNGC